MSVDLTLTITGDETARNAIRSRVERCEVHRVATRVAVPCAKHWRNSLAAMPKNRMGYPSTGFYEDAARRVVGLAQGGNVLLTSDKLGLRQRLHGGTITARNGKYLTIPICAEAYGTKVSDWGIENLVFVINRSTGNRFFALWLGSENATSILSKRRSAPGYANRAEVTTRRANKFRAANAGQKKPDVMFVGGSGGTSKAAVHNNLKFLFLLKHSVDQAANPNVIPADMGEVAFEAVIEATK